MSSGAASPPEVGVVLVAAGAGVRAGPGQPKAFRPIGGVPMLSLALKPFTTHPDVAHVAVAVPAAEADAPPPWLAALAGRRLTVVAGGATRAESVRAGLAALPEGLAVVLVHDAARPFVSRATIDAVIARARAGVGAVPAVPVSDTIKEVDGGRRIVRTVSRERLWRAQTPQGFPRAMLAAAYAAFGAGAPPPTDDSAVCERAGFPVEVVPDRADNVKITTPEDFVMAEALTREPR